MAEPGYVALNRATWTQANAEYTDRAAHDAWAREEIGWGQWHQPESEVRMLPDFAGKDVVVVLLFWTIKKLAQGQIDVVDFPPEYGKAAEEVSRLLKEKKVPRISEMFQEARQVGHFRLIACSAGLEYMGVDPEAVAKNVDEVMGLPAILSLTAGAETTLFI